MSYERKDREICIKKIYDAFPAIELSADKQIISQYDCSVEAQELKEALYGKKWFEIDCDYLNKYAIQGLYLLEFSAYRYFLPAFMLCSLNHYDYCFDIVVDTVESLIPPLVLHKLGRCGNTKSIDMYTFQCRMNNLTQQQKDAIVAFLEYLDTHHKSDFQNEELRLALTDYWFNQLEFKR